LVKFKDPLLGHTMSSTSTLRTTSQVDPLSCQLPRQMLAAALSCGMANSTTNPFDVAKTRLQTDALLGATSRNYPTLRATMLHTYAEEGIVGVWMPGLLAATLREFTYSGVRMGLYKPVRNLLDDHLGGIRKDTTTSSKVVSGLLCGVIGSAFSTPIDAVKIIFQREPWYLDPKTGLYLRGHLRGTRPSFSNTFTALHGLYLQGGLRRLYNGLSPNVLRAAINTCGQLSSYDHTKQVMRNRGYQESFGLHAFSGIVSAFVATTVVVPVDLCKTRIMADPQRKVFRNPWHCIVLTVRMEGAATLFRGWFPLFYRQAPNFVFAFVLLEQFRKLLGLNYL